MSSYNRISKVFLGLDLCLCLPTDRSTDNMAVLLTRLTRLTTHMCPSIEKRSTWILSFTIQTQHYGHYYWQKLIFDQT